MGLEYLTMVIKYHIKSGMFNISGDVNEQGQYSLIEEFLLGQVGAGVDERKANEKEMYTIMFKWYPEDDTIEPSDDTGNKGLRDGILLHIFQKLPEPKPYLCEATSKD